MNENFFFHFLSISYYEHVLNWPMPRRPNIVLAMKWKEHEVIEESVRMIYKQFIGIKNNSQFDKINFFYL